VPGAITEDVQTASRLILKAYYKQGIIHLIEAGLLEGASSPIIARRVFMAEGWTDRAELTMLLFDLMEHLEALSQDIIPRLRLP